MDRAFETMIALVSDQRMQNIIPLFQNGLSVEKLILVVSGRGKGRNARYLPIAESLKSALELDLHTAGIKVHIFDKGMPAFAVNEAREYIEGLLEMHGVEGTVLNITGGTKPMFIAAYLAAQEKGAPVIYVDTTDQKFIWFGPKGKFTDEPFDLAPISAETALRAHGYQVDYVRMANSRATPQQLAFIRVLNSKLSALKRLVNSVRILSSVKLKNVRGVYSIPRTKLRIDKTVEQAAMTSGFFEFLDDNVRMPKENWEFLLGGDWLEAYTYTILKDSGKFSDVQVNVPVYTGDVWNELDVICMAGEKIALLECKSGKIMTDPKDDKNKDYMEVLHKVDALKQRLGGVFAKTFVVTQMTRDEVRSAMRSRAEGYGIGVITSGQLPHIDQLVLKALTEG